MKHKLSRLFLIFISLISTVFAQDSLSDAPDTPTYQDTAISLFIGDNAPQLSVSKWIKGKPIKSYQRGHVYVIEFWATWCAPCRAAMPHLSALAKKFPREMTIIGVDVLEDASEEKVKQFVDSMGSGMGYHVALDQNKSMYNYFLTAGGRKEFGIPQTFVVDNYGKIAWVGHPSELENVLPYIIDRQWDLAKEREKVRWTRYIDSLDKEVSFELTSFNKQSNDSLSRKSAESALAFLDSMIAKTPALNFRIHTGFGKMSSLMKIDQERALEYGYELFNYADTFRYPGYEAVLDVIADTENVKITNPTLYKLAAVSYEKKIERTVYPELYLTPKMYSSLAYYYWKSGEAEKAIDTQKKALTLLKSKNRYKPTELEKLEESLVLYEATD